MKRRFVTMLAFLTAVLISGRAMAAQRTPTAPPPELAFTYHDNWWSHSAFLADAATYRTVSGDFNGDGQDDIAMLYRSDATTVNFYVILSAGDHFEWAGSWSQQGGYLHADMMTGRVVAGDFNNDGYDDVAAFAGNSATYAYVFLSNGSSFSGYTWWSGSLTYQGKITGRVVAGDFDGDGFEDDIAALYDEGSAGTRADVFISNGSSFANPQIWWSSSAFAAANTTYRVVAGDFDGNGQDDIATIYHHNGNITRAHLLVSTGSSFTYQWGWWEHLDYAAGNTTGRVVAGDFDGDGDDDISLLYAYPDLLTRAHVLLSTGSHFSYQSNGGWWEHPIYSTAYATGRVVAGDWDGNGVDDASMIYRTTASSARAQVLAATAPSPGPATTRQVDSANPACNDGSGTPYCTVQAAIYAANDGDTIALAAGTYDEHITVPRYDDAGFNQSLLITGAGAGQTVVDGSSNGRVFTIYAGGNIELGAMTIQNGLVSGSNGGGIYNAGQLKVHDATVSANAAATGLGGGIANVADLQLHRTLVSSNTAQEGGGVYSTGVLLVTDSSFNLNTAYLWGDIANGGGLRTAGSGQTTVESTTFYGNFSYGNGGGISQTGSGSTVVQNSTISGNGAGAGGGLHNFGSNLTIINSTITDNSANSGYGRGLRTYDGGLTYLQFSIIAQTGSDNCSNNNDGSSTVSLGYNLATDQTCSLTQPTDRPGQEPQLGSLQDNGGPTQTHALLEGSPAIDAGNSQCPATDQRGVPRPQDGDDDGTALCDLGAFEYRPQQFIYLPLVVKS